MKKHRYHFGCRIPRHQLGCRFTNHPKITFDLTKFLSFATFLERLYFVQRISEVFFVNELFVLMIKKIIGKFLSIFFN
jgi:hypothetical protein